MNAHGRGCYVSGDVEIWQPQVLGQRNHFTVINLIIDKTDCLPADLSTVVNYSL